MVTMSNYLTKKTLLHQVFFHDKKKFKNHPIIEKLYKDTMQEHIFQGHTSKINKTEAKTTAPITNYLSHHRDKIISKTDKIRIAFDVGAKIQ